ncbi:hypothetical protein VP01_10465g2, partial [Puccinia sorghi]
MHFATLAEPIQLGRRCTNLLDCLTVLPAVATSLPSLSLPRLVILFEPPCSAASSRFAVFLPEEGMLHFIYH